MSSSAKRATNSRELKRRFHRRRARLWNILLIIVNGLFPFTQLFALWPLLVIAMFVEEVFIDNKHSSVLRLLQRFVVSLMIAPAVIIFGWWVLFNVREIRNKHVRLAAGYAQSSAEEVLANARNFGHKFGLFLRGFESEVASTTYYGPNPEIGSREAEILARPVEALLVEMLDEDVPLVALADPRDPEPMEGVYRFESVPEKWEQFICELLPDAFPVVMHLASLSPGIMVELEFISSPPYSSKAVIVVSRSLAIRNSPGGRVLLKFLSRFDHIVFEQIDKDWSQEREKEFHARLQERLQALERDAQSARSIMGKGKVDFTLVTQSRLRRVTNFMKGPALGVSILIALLTIMGWLVEGFNVNHLWSDTSHFIMLWLKAVIVVSALKGVTYILGFAQSPGENQRFPTFSRVVKWVKKHSTTPK